MSPLVTSSTCALRYGAMVITASGPLMITPACPKPQIARLLSITCTRPIRCVKLPITPQSAWVERKPATRYNGVCVECGCDEESEVMLSIIAFIVGIVLLFKGSFRLGNRQVARPQARAIGFSLIAPLVIVFCVYMTMAPSYVQINDDNTFSF